ncbi:hypothetical protein [Pseudomonas sp. Q1]|uniref:hypothetical protein n=1 Tax=Pseudomonas sp. Q1 TaxID=2202823 RepID=UPI0021157D31|nr:hypothetical protein [Pseudomonas sp. Q1]
MPTENKAADHFGTNGRTFHIHLSVCGAIRDVSKHELKGMFRVDGRECTTGEVKNLLLEGLAQDKEVLPFGPPCDGFDFSGKGVPRTRHPSTGCECP